MTYLRASDLPWFKEYGARVGSLLSQKLVFKRDSTGSKTKKNLFFAYVACSVDQIIELARTGSLNFRAPRTYVVLASQLEEIAPTLSEDSDLAQLVINHRSQKEKDAVAAIANEPTMCNTLAKRLLTNEFGAYLADRDSPIQYVDLAAIKAVSDRAKKVLAPFVKEFLYSNP